MSGELLNHERKRYALRCRSCPREIISRVGGEIRAPDTVMRADSHSALTTGPRACELPLLPSNASPLHVAQGR